MFEIKCSDCGKTAMVPFKPTAGKPASILADTGTDGVVVASGSKTGYSLAADQSAVFQWSYSIDDKKAV